MDKSDRPEGRKKRVGSGGGGVFKRGEGVGGQTGGPVGDADGYSERTDGAQAPEAEKPDKGVIKPSAGSLFGGGHAGGGSTSGGGVPTGTATMPTGDASGGLGSPTGGVGGAAGGGGVPTGFWP